MKNKLILLDTPLGNLDDLSPRTRSALELSPATYIVEDTRVFRQLCRHLGISVEGKNIRSFHDHSSVEGLADLVAIIKAQEETFLLSDAGNPVLCDPALPLIQACLKEGVEIDHYPGPSAITSAVALSGLPSIPLHFYGFLPRTLGARKRLFTKAQQGGGSSVFFVGPHHLEKVLLELQKDFPRAQVCVARELTKKFQEVSRFLAQEPPKDLIYKGEVTLVVSFPEVCEIPEEDLRLLAQEILEKGTGKKLLAKLLGKILHKSSKEIYRQLT